MPGNSISPSSFAKKALLMANFCVETNRMESFFAVYFIIFKDWNEVNIGIISIVMNVMMIAFQTPAGDIMDKTSHKKAITAVAILIAAVTTVSVVWTSTFWIVLMLKILEGIAATIFLPALMTLLLGICVDKDEEQLFIARAEMYNKIGSVLFTLGCAFITYFLYPDISSMFYLLGSGGLAATFFIWLIPESAIDFDRARKLAKTADDTDANIKSKEEPKNVEEDLAFEDNPSQVKKAEAMSYSTLLCSDKNILAFGITTFVYHLSNAGVTPILSQYIAIDNEKTAMTFVSANLLVAYFGQGITAYLMEKYMIQNIEHRTLVIMAHLILPIRCGFIFLLIQVWDNNYALTSTMLFEGIGAGIFDTIIPIIVGTLTEGTGRYGFAFGFVITCWRIGHGCSVLLGEFLVHDFGYSVTFISLGSIGIVALIIFMIFVDTRNELNNDVDEVCVTNDEEESTDEEESAEA